MTVRWLVVSLFMAGCGDARDGTKSADPPAYWELAEDLRLDANEEDFSQVGRMVVGRNGEIVISLRQDGEIRVYDSAGKRTATIGRKGEGPGEFGAIGSLMWAGDTLVVDDFELRRLTWFGPDWRYVRTRNLPVRFSSYGSSADSTIGFFSPVAVQANGTLVGNAMIGGAQPGGRGIRNGVNVLLTSDGTAYGPVLFAMQLNDPRWSMEVAGFGNAVPFTSPPQLAVAPDGNRFAILTVDQREGGSYKVLVMAVTGDTILNRSYPFDPVSIPQSAIDSALAEFDQPVREGPTNLNERFKAMARDRMPSVYSPVQAIRIGLDNTIWIDRPTADGRRSAMVLDERGDSIGAVLIPERSRIQQANRSHVWMTERDEFDLASVVRYRVNGP